MKLASLRRAGATARWSWSAATSPGRARPRGRRARCRPRWTTGCWREPRAAADRGRARCRGCSPGAFPFDAGRASPLPRAYQWADGSAYVNHVELVRQARGAEMPSFWTDPLMYQGGSDGFLGPRDPIPLADEAWGCDLEGEVAVVTGDVPMGASRRRRSQAIRLVMLCNDVSLRNLIPRRARQGLRLLPVQAGPRLLAGGRHARRAGADWKDGKLHRPLLVRAERQAVGRGRRRRRHDLRLRDPDRPRRQDPRPGGGHDHRLRHGRPTADPEVGGSCIAEARTRETLEHGEPRTPFMRFGDTVRIEMVDRAGASVFGAIEQVARRHEGAG